LIQAADLQYSPEAGGLVMPFDGKSPFFPDESGSLQDIGLSGIVYRTIESKIRFFGLNTYQTRPK